MTGVILVDKPSDWTSNDVVCKLKGVTHTRRIGHSGTLDPMATGLLPVFLGKATKAVEFAENDVKHYVAGIKLGTVTDTLDITGRIISVSIPESEIKLRAALPNFVGNIQQIPPMYSAIKINGQKLYNIARSGSEIVRTPRAITVFSLELSGKVSDEEYILDIVCSKGTYVRSLCDDIGRFLGCGACMSSLRRISCGRYSISEAIKLEELIKTSAEEIENKYLIPVDTVFGDYPATMLDKENERRIRLGNIIDSGLSDGYYRVYSSSGEFMIIGSVQDGVMKIRKNFIE